MPGLQAADRRPSHDRQRPRTDVSRVLRGLQAKGRRVMDHARYLAYRSTLRSLERMPEWLLASHERERLRDTAEALLLTNDLEEAERLRRDAALALSLLVGQRRYDDARADAVWSEISDCGPPAPAGVARRSRALTFAGAL